MDAVLDIRSKLSHFRILILGRANAGKTTILKGVCNSVEDPEIFNLRGKKARRRIDPLIVQESAERGLHNIEHQLIFKSNPQFIFHDSRGFESGSVEEIDGVKSFITRRAEEVTLADQLHAIWYCIPTDTARPLLAADEEFFENDIARKGESRFCSFVRRTRLTKSKVPLVAIFTKSDGLVTEAFNALRASGKSIKDARKLQASRAQDLLETNFLEPLKSKKYPPAGYVQLDDMRKETSGCHELIETTANAIDDKALQLLFVSVQQNNIGLCVTCAIRSGLISLDIVQPTLSWFPHVWVRLEVICVRLQCAQRIFCRTIDEVKHILAICICAEQTFSEGSAYSRGFASAFENAMEHYAGSELEAHAIQQYNESSAPSSDWRRRRQTLFDIIQSHPLRTYLLRTFVSRFDVLQGIGPPSTEVAEN
ncbi:GTP-binding protein [Favolaschia claudopus]|uniref:GTP-binding protein n=1 Tax=Favolaschia claudopus TaxID=2862362 RepID=A0AAW0BJS6_9AGAR